MTVISQVYTVTKTTLEGPVAEVFATAKEAVEVIRLHTMVVDVRTIWQKSDGTFTMAKDVFGPEEFHRLNS